MTYLFILLGLVVGAMLVGGILAFLPSKALGDLEKRVFAERKAADSTSGQEKKL